MGYIELKPMIINPITSMILDILNLADRYKDIQKFTAEEVESIFVKLIMDMFNIVIKKF